MSNDRTKYINIDWNFIKEQWDNKMTCMPFISLGDQIVIIMTKGLLGSKVNKPFKFSSKTSNAMEFIESHI